MLNSLKVKGMSTFVLVWLGQLVSHLGTSLSNFAIDIWVYQKTGSATQLSFLILFTTLPLVIVSPFAGVLVDRWDRRWVMILSNSGAALSTLTIAFLLVTQPETIQIWHICLATAVSSSFSALRWPAYNAVTALLVPKDNLGRANGMSQLTQPLAQLLSPVFGSVLAETIQLSGIIVLDLASCLFALTTLLVVHFPDREVKEDQEVKETSLLEETLYGLRYLNARSGLLALLLLFASINLFLGILEVLTYPLILSFASSIQLSMVMSFGGVGMLTGSLLMSTLANGKKNYINILLIFMLLNGFSMVIAGLQPSVFLLSLAIFVYSLALSFINGSGLVILQKQVDPEVQGRVFSLNNAISGSCLPLAYLLAGPLSDKVFEPLMVVDGPLAQTIGQFIGTGPGRGIGLIFILSGISIILVTIFAYQYAPLRLLEDGIAESGSKSIAESEAMSVEGLQNHLFIQQPLEDELLNVCIGDKQ